MRNTWLASSSIPFSSCFYILFLFFILVSSHTHPKMLVMPVVQVIGNHMFNCFAFGVKTMSSPQGEMCGNDIKIPEGVDNVRVVLRG